VIAQAVLGGVHVLERLPLATGIAHAALAQAFLCLTVILALATGPTWLAARAVDDAGADTTRRLTIATVAAVYGQILLGAIVRHTGSGLVIPPFPLANGRLWPVIDSSFVAWQMSHRVGALIVTCFATWTAVRVLRRHGAVPALRRPARLLLALLV